MLAYGEGGGRSGARGIEDVKCVAAGGNLGKLDEVHRGGGGLGRHRQPRRAPDPRGESPEPVCATKRKNGPCSAIGPVLPRPSADTCGGTARGREKAAHHKRRLD